MLEDSNDGFQIVHSRKKKNVAEFERKLAIESEKQRNNNCHYHDEGIGCSPTESPTECDEILGNFLNSNLFISIFFYVSLMFRKQRAATTNQIQEKTQET